MNSSIADVQNINYSGGAGAITAVSNISSGLLSFIVKNWREESSISNFSLSQPNP